MKNRLTLDENTFLKTPMIDTSTELEVYGITDIEAVCAKLRKLYGEVTVSADGNKSELSDVKRADSIVIDAQPDFRKNRYNIADVLRVIDRLTRKDGGCPWDKAQTHDSIRINMIEEAYEAVDAIDKRDIPNMREEFGDVLLQSVLQSDIAKRSDEFDFDDVCDELCKKLIGRHTFIFGEDSASDAEEALSVWEKNKGIEKHYDSVKTQLSRLPENFPALLLCQKTYKKLKKASAASDPRAALENAVATGDHTRTIAAATALLSDEGKDAEAELNKLIKDKINSL